MALSELDARRNRALSVNNARIVEIESSIPEIKMIRTRMSGTGLELFRAAVNGSGSLDERLASLRDANIEAQGALRALLKANGYDEDYLKVQYICERCEDTGFVGGERCDCLRQLLNRYAYSELNLSSKMQLCSFDSFRTDLYPDGAIGSCPNCRTAMSGILGYCKKYADGFTMNSKSICMLGLTGLGKTHLSLAIARRVSELGYNVAYGSAPNFLRAVEKEHFGRGAGDTDTMELLLSADLLILDDLGAEFESQFYISTVYNIVNTRMNAGMPTIISSNFTPQELQRRYTDRIVSRVLATYDYLCFFGEDIRQLKKIRGME